ncbi:hypothetical protein HMN09_01165100 [Mycena chlorophos]|uniref:DNA polymerase delta subunit 4 n=1 Tax=Mycena chlorophos TaxID=658473 RepID=A0A8H6S7N4_MYCCL|nr:hypothetical protein HMN09_01165100 [Mycena chlorophos]
MPKAAKPSSSLKQATLSFNTSKTTAPVTKKRTTFSDSEDDAKPSSSGARAEKLSSFTTPAKKRVAAVPVKLEDPISDWSEDDQEELIDSEDPNEPIDLDPKDLRWKQSATAAKTKRGNVKLIHAENKTVFDDILRVFDLSYEYGPCIGITRLQRWERAHAMGLSPPVEVHDILVSKQSEDYAQPVFTGLV